MLVTGSYSRYRRHGGDAARHRLFVLLLPAVVALLCASGVRAAAPLPGPATGVVRPTSRGAVSGFVLDAQTRRPLAKARVRIEEGGGFAEAGPTVALTNEVGRYMARALIGRSWKKIDWMRVFTSFPPLLLLRPQSAMKQSRTVVATSLNVRAECEGYQPFVGEVQAEQLDAGRFAVFLHDVWLAPAGSNLASFSPDHLQREYVESFRVEPAVARPGERVTVTARIRIPFERGGRYRVFFDSTEPALVKTEQPLKPVGPPDPKTGVSTFQRVVTLPRAPKVWTTELGPWISHNYQEIPVGWEFKALLQVVQDDKERAIAERVKVGYDHLVEDRPGAAVEALRGAAAAAPAYAPAYRYLGEACREVGRPDEAAAAFERLVALSPEDLEVALPRYAEALLENGQLEAAARALETGEKRSKRPPAAVALARARLSARRGDMRAADEQLARAGKSGRIPRALQREIALRRAEAALRADPESPDAELALARALADLDRGEEAARHARRACSLRPDEPWPLVELAALERRLGHEEGARAALERAQALDPQNADASLGLAELLVRAGETARARELFRRAAERRPYDFRVRHGLALVELREALQPPVASRQSPVEASGDRPSPLAPGARRQASVEPALEQLQVAAVIGRGKGELDAGFELPFGFLTTLRFDPKRHTVEGFARREAADDYRLAQALERLKARPDDAMASFNAGAALARLGLPDLALAALERAAALQPELAELPYWRGVALLELRRPAEARRALEEAIRRNPMHPHAYPMLARLCLEAGEMEQAQSYLATYRRHWPHVREREIAVQE